MLAESSTKIIDRLEESEHQGACLLLQRGLGAVSKFFLGSIAEDAEKGTLQILVNTEDK